MIELTEQQGRQLAESEPVVVDPLTQQRYVLVRAEVYERMCKALEDDAALTTAESLDRILAEDDAADPYLAELQKKYGGLA